MSEVTIVGAGIVGAACAYECARAGLRTLVIDQSESGGGVTSAGMGHIVVMDDSPAQLALTAWSRRLWDELSQELGTACELDRCGTIWVAEDEDDERAMRDKHALYEQHGVESELLDGRALLAREPQLRGGLSGGLRVPGDLVVYQPSCVEWLLEQACAHGAVIRKARARELGERRIDLAAGEVLRSDFVIDACGTAALDLLDEELRASSDRLGLRLRARKGHLAITARYPGFATHQLIELGYLKSAHGDAKSSVAFNLQPRKTGQMLLGSSRDFGAEDDAIDNATLARMLARAEDFLPRIGELQLLRCWTGFRAASDDHLPWIGAMPGHEGLLLAAGHEGLGITTSLATAKLLADSMIGRKPAIDPAPYLPARNANGATSA